MAMNALPSTFRLWVRSVRQRSGNFLAIHFTKTFAQAMHFHAGRAFVHAQSLRDGRIVNRAAHRHETVFLRVVFAGFAARGELRPKPVDGRPNQANRSEPVRAAYCRHWQNIAESLQLSNKGRHPSKRFKTVATGK